MTDCLCAITHTYTIIYTHISMRREKHHLLGFLLLLEEKKKKKMYCLQVAAYHLFFNASRICYLLALIIFVFLRFFAIFQNTEVNQVVEPRTTTLLRFTDTKGDVNVTFSGVFLESVIKDITDNLL
ncbi:uncharacterized protein LOC9328975 [Arabidopsis lyrata subsp. lyrata]|nr:uncharacterized protein LOC9328975 [Arabidopsis lyrata subsp. lyrata]|eukprot:XP_002892913.2 uncharacterized protein LOC9328975 [Arabidopsis lyrata subsp. lyrata]